MTKKLITLLVLLATVTLTTAFVVIPVGPAGFFSLSDIAVVFSGLFIAYFLNDQGKKSLLLISFLVAGVGAGAADIFLGYGIWAPITLVAKGLEASMAYLSLKRKGVFHLLFLVLGGLFMVATYFIGQAFFLSTDGGVELALSGISTNLLQALAGLFAGRILFMVAQKIIKK